MTFTVIKEVGRTKVCKYFVALHTETQQKVYIKTLYKKKFESLGIEYPPREISILKCLTHPNLIQLYEIIIEEECKKINIVMEYVSSKTLSIAIPPNVGLDEKFARFIFREIVLVTDYLHSQGIIHRNFQLENILLRLHYSPSEDGQTTGAVKITDFGDSNSFEENQFLSTYCGTSEYLSPELLNSYPYCGPPVDIWAIGVILYTMIAGEFPFPSAVETLAGHYSFSPKFSVPLQDLLRRIFVVDPQFRISIQEILLHPWINDGYPPLEQPSFKIPQFDPVIIDKMKKMGCLHPESSIIEFSSATTFYYLSKKNLEYHQPDEDEDLSSINFNFYNDFHHHSSDCTIL